MNRRRYTVATSLMAVAVAALGLAALCVHSVAWMWSALGLTLVALNVAAFGAICGTGRARVRRAAFALIGGQYLILSLVPPLPDEYWGWTLTEEHSAAPTEAAFRRLAHEAFPVQPTPGRGRPTLSVQSTGGPSYDVDPDRWMSSCRAMKIAHMLTSLIIGSIASGIVSMIFVLRDRSTAARTPSPPAG